MTPRLWNLSPGSPERNQSRRPGAVHGRGRQQSSEQVAERHAAGAGEERLRRRPVPDRETERRRGEQGGQGPGRPARPPRRRPAPGQLPNEPASTPAIPSMPSMNVNRLTNHSHRGPAATRSRSGGNNPRMTGPAFAKAAIPIPTPSAWTASRPAGSSGRRSRKPPREPPLRRSLARTLTVACRTRPLRRGRRRDSSKASMPMWLRARRPGFYTSDRWSYGVTGEPGPPVVSEPAIRAGCRAVDPFEGCKPNSLSL